MGYETAVKLGDDRWIGKLVGRYDLQMTPSNRSVQNMCAVAGERHQW